MAKLKKGAKVRIKRFHMGLNFINDKNVKVGQVATVIEPRYIKANPMASDEVADMVGLTHKLWNPGGYGDLWWFDPEDISLVKVKKTKKKVKKVKGKKS